MTPPANGHTFPHGAFFKKREGNVIRVKDHIFRLTKDIKEWDDDVSTQWTVIFEAEEITNGNSDISNTYGDYLTVNLSLHPFCFKLYDHKALWDNFDEIFEREWKAIKDNEGSGHTPQYITHEVQRQSEFEDPYPGGAVRIIAMSKMDGVQLYPHFLRKAGGLVLNAEDMSIIRQQVLETIQHMLLQGWDGGVNPFDLYYNQEQKQIFFLGLSRLSPLPVNYCEDERFGPITEDTITEDSWQFREFRGMAESERIAGEVE